MQCLFVQLRCRPGTAYAVADAIAGKELHSEMYSTSGEFDLLIKFYVPAEVDIGRFVNESLLDVDGIERSFTTLTFRAF